MHYQLDTKLSRLRCQPGTVARLFLAYLHAVTSAVVPDPLTGHTGTQEALRILREQSLRASKPIDDDTISFLNSIAALTPARQFYPVRLRKMQTVNWKSSLGQLAQHEEFYTLVEDITHYAAQLEMLYDGRSLASDMKGRGQEHLLRRAVNRGHSIRNTSLGVKTKDDYAYNPRDRDCSSDQARRVYEIASLVRQWPSNSNALQDLASRVRQWQRIEGYHQHLDISPLTCNDLLAFPVGQKWGSLYELSRKCHQSADRYRLMRLFTMIAYNQDDSMPVVRTLLGIACSGAFAGIQPPKPSYDLGLGTYPDWNQVQNAITRSVVELRRNDGEKKGPWNERLAWFRSDKKREVNSAVDHIRGDWPCDAPVLPGFVSVSIRPETAADCQRLFTAWNDNRKSIMHIEEVQSELLKIHSPSTNVPKTSSPAKSQQRGETVSIAVAPDLISLLCERSPPTRPDVPEPFQERRPCQPAKDLPGLDELERAIKGMREGDLTRQEYADDLRASLAALKTADLPETPES